jgi:hypothetical protein
VRCKLGYAAVIQALGLLDALSRVADPSHDAVGLAMATENLPQRIRLRRPVDKRDV